MHTATGKKKIADIRENDYVIAYDESKQDTVLSQVLHTVKKTWYQLSRVVTDRDTIWTTENHPFYVPSLGRYLRADSLRRGMQMLALSGTLMTVQSVASADSTVHVYNFEVADHHNYFVGDEGVLVHNDNGKCPLWVAKLRKNGPNGVLIDATDDDVLNLFQSNILRGELQKAFEDGNTDFLYFFTNGLDISIPADLAIAENRVRAWEVARRAGLEPEIRLNVADLDRISTYQTATGKSSDDIVAEIESSAITARGSTRSWLDNIPSGGGIQVGTHGDYLIRENAEIFYRGISESDYQHLLNTGELRGTSETVTSPNLEYIVAKRYRHDGRVVKFYATPGTLDNLFGIGVRDRANRTMNYYPNLPHVSTVDSWTQNNVLFKTEGGELVDRGVLDDTQVNIGLGVGEGLGRFNAGLQAFEVVHIY